MRTTIEIPDELFISAKKRAAELRQPLRALFERALRAEFGRTGAVPRRAKTVRLKRVTVAGMLPAGIDPADRAAMHDRLARQRCSRSTPIC